ncbi:tRNA pseudouridine(38-40) synthase TruA [bacterium]|nr:tRNA pseudouridine(38-40) synthase TruA [candidate division CSSED10-310 bacterium]
MRNIKLKIQYDGTDFHGFQIQPSVRTVQKVLEDVLSRITSGPVKLATGARTDAGVHAYGQVVNFRTVSMISTDKLLKGTNALLPADVSLRFVEEVPDGFHARFSAQSRTYVYRIDTSPLRSPFNRQFALHYPGNLALDAMLDAAEYLKGEQDFSSFKSAHDATRHAVRRMIRIWGKQNGTIISLYFQANAFLQHMVRNIVGTLLWVGRGRLSVDRFKIILDERDRKSAGPTIGPQGLCLLEIRYPDDPEFLDPPEPFPGI